MVAHVLLLIKSTGSFISNHDAIVSMALQGDHEERLVWHMWQLRGDNSFVSVCTLRHRAPGQLCRVLSLFSLTTLSVELAFLPVYHYQPSMSETLPPKKPPLFFPEVNPHRLKYAETVSLSPSLQCLVSSYNHRI